jgi:PAS domain-containing protein
MNEQQRHIQLVREVYEQMREIFEKSEQAIYLYLDDIHKVCNQKFATLLGYASPEEWARVEDSFPKFVAEDSQETLIGAYQRAMEKLAGSCFKVTWNKKSGGTVNTDVILVPIAHKGELLALHFIS